jgi:hypothetical protein
MRKLLFTIATLSFALFAQGQEMKIALEAPGTLAHLLIGAGDVEEIVISGTMNDADFTALRQLKHLETVDLRKVKNKQLGDSLFFGMTNLESVRLPKKLKRLGRCTFEGCTELEYVGFPMKMDVIPDFTFKDCKKLDKLDVYNSKVDRIGKGAFMNSGIRIIPLPKELRRIDMLAFMNCQRMEQIRIPKWVLEIGALAFANCTSLRDILVRTEMPPSCAQDAFVGLEKCTLHVLHPELYRDRSPWNKIDLEFDAYNGQELKTFDRSDIPIKKK